MTFMMHFVTREPSKDVGARLDFKVMATINV